MSKTLKYIRIGVLVLNCIGILMLWMSCASTWLHPASFPRLALLGLLFPVFMCINLAFIPLWLVVNYRRAWIPLAALLPIAMYILDYCPISIEHDVPKKAIKVLSWNTNHFGGNYEDKEEGKRLTIDYIINSDADIICLQESVGSGEVIDSFYTEMEKRGYKRDCYRSTQLLSRFDILDLDSIDYETQGDANGAKGNGSKWYRLKVDGRELVLVNNHLESNHLVDSIKQKYVSNLDNPEYDGMKESGRAIGRNLTSSTSRRGGQADSLACFAQRHEGEYIVMCGDFNDTPISYTYQRVNRELKSAFRQSGKGIGLSYNKRGFWVRIDHLFMSSNISSYNTYIDNTITTSDHYPLVSWLDFE